MHRVDRTVPRSMLINGGLWPRRTNIAGRSGRSTYDLQNFSGGIMPGNSAHRAAAQRARAAEENILPFSFNAPFPDLFLRCGKRPGRGILKNIAMIHSE